jgi:hypothetical protein
MPRALALVAACCLIGCENFTSSPTSPAAGMMGDSCSSDSDCASGYICDSIGRCLACSPVALPGQVRPCEYCTPGVLACNGNDVIACAPSGVTYTVQQSCSVGCVDGACVDPVCVAGVQRCSSGDVEECLPDGSEWTIVQQCPAGCAISPGNPNAAECVENG